MAIKPKIHKNIFWAGILLAQFILFFLLSKTGAAVRAFEAFFERQKSVHQKIFSEFGFSAGDVFYLLLIVVIVYLLWNIIRKKNRKKFLTALLILLNVFYFLYQLFWGMLYFQNPLIEKLPSTEPTLDFAKETAIRYLQLCKEDRAQLKEDRNGVFKVWDRSAIESEILQNQNRLPGQISDKTGSGVHSFKPALWNRAMSYTGISGYYNPFTAEAQYNQYLPSTSIPFTLAHESAHQMGFAREQEASFIAYLIGKDSENKELRYSTRYYALRSLLHAIQETDPAFVENILQQYSEGMRRDRLYERNFAVRHSGLADAFFAVTNDLFLKSNQQEGSITYSYFVDLMLRYEAQKKNRVSQHDSKNTNDEKKFIAFVARTLSKAS